MALGIKAALQGNLRVDMEKELAAGEQASMRAMRSVAGRAKQRLRDQVTGAGMGQRLANTWREEVYPRRGSSLNAAALVFSRAPQIVRAFNEGVTIRSANGFYLAIPTEAVPKNLSFVDPGSGTFRRNARATPRGVEQALGLKLRLVYRGGGRPSLLVADDARLSKRGLARRAAKTKIAKGQVATVVMFILVPSVRLPKRFSVSRVESQAAAELPLALVSEWNALAIVK